MGQRPLVAQCCRLPDLSDASDMREEGRWVLAGKADSLAIFAILDGEDKAKLDAAGGAALSRNKRGPVAAQCAGV